MQNDQQQNHQSSSTPAAPPVNPPPVVKAVKDMNKAEYAAAKAKFLK